MAYAFSELMECPWNVLPLNYISQAHLCKSSLVGLLLSRRYKEAGQLYQKSKLTNYLLKSPPVKQLFAEADTVFLKRFN